MPCSAYTCLDVCKKSLTYLQQFSRYLGKCRVAPFFWTTRYMCHTTCCFKSNQKWHLSIYVVQDYYYFTRVFSCCIKSKIAYASIVFHLVDVKLALYSNECTKHFLVTFIFDTANNGKRAVCDNRRTKLNLCIVCRERRCKAGIHNRLGCTWSDTLHRHISTDGTCLMSTQHHTCSLR